jgi:simple sugar transport system substrate-binding protein
VRKVLEVFNPPQQRGRRHGSRALARAFAALAIALLAAAAVGCGSSGSGSSPAGKRSTTASSGKQLKFFFISHAPAADPFSQIELNGVDEARQQFGVDVTFRGPTRQTFDAADEARLIRQAVAAKPDGIITSDPSPDSINPAIKAAVDAGIPVVIFNQGNLASVEQTGALGFVGQDETEGGRRAGAALCRTGATHVGVITIPPGTVSVDDRVRGLDEGFTCGRVTPIVVQISQISNPAAVKAAIQAALAKDASIDAMFSIGGGLIPAMMAARAASGARADKIHWASFDTTVDSLKALSRGQLGFLIDQQPFLQGYLPVQILAHYLRYGLLPQPLTPTGPSLVTPATAGQVVDLVAKRIR